MISRKVYSSICAACVLGLAARSAMSQPVQLRMLTHNVYSLDENQCEERGQAFGNIVAHATPAYDVVGLQEYYGNPDPHITCDSDFLSDAIWCTGRYADGDQYYRFYPEDGIFFDGGIGIFTMGSICDFHDWQWTYQESGAVQGVILARVQIPGSTVTLDVYVVHLHALVDACDRCCRKQELEELATIISQNSRRSGNPVIVMGDFNIGGPPACCGNSGYEDIMNIFGWPRDLWLEWLGQWSQIHPCGVPLTTLCDEPDTECTILGNQCNCCVCLGATPPPMAFVLDSPGFGCTQPTFGASGSGSSCSTANCAGTPAAWAGFTNDGSVNGLSDSQDRIDYIFVITDPSLSSSAFDVTLNNTQVVNWKVVLPPTAVNVSDHLGVESTVTVSGMPSVWVDSAQSGGGTGTSCNPFPTVSAGVSAAPDGNRVLVRSGVYSQALTINRNLRLQAVGGLVTIGS